MELTQSKATLQEIEGAAPQGLGSRIFEDKDTRNAFLESRFVDLVSKLISQKDADNWEVATFRDTKNFYPQSSVDAQLSATDRSGEGFEIPSFKMNRFAQPSMVTTSSSVRFVSECEGFEVHISRNETKSKDSSGATIDEKLWFHGSIKTGELEVAIRDRGLVESFFDAVYVFCTNEGRFCCRIGDRQGEFANYLDVP